MGRIWAIATHTIREAIRMKVVVAFKVLMLLLIVLLPIGIHKPDASVSYMVQTFLSWSLSPIGALLSFLAIFLAAKSISEEMYHKQIFTLVTKPLPRWQYILGKWCGVVAVLTYLLIICGSAIYGGAKLLASKDNPDEVDQHRLKYEVFAARAHSSLYVPDFKAEVERQFQQQVEDGVFTSESKISAAKHKAALRVQLVQRWRSIQPGEVRAFKFEKIALFDTPPDAQLQLRYKAKGLGYAKDEVLQTVWVFGDPRNAEVTKPIVRRDVKERFHTIYFPASAVSPDGSLIVQVQNLDFKRGGTHKGATIAFEAKEGFEVLYVIGSFEGNLMRTLFLVWCRIVLIAGVSIFAATWLSFPVACLVGFLFYVLAISREYVKDALSFGAKGSGVLGPTQFLLEPILDALFWLWPDFSRYDGVPTFVDGRNVTLMWNLDALGKLVCITTVVFLMAACIVFRRRQVAELSV